MLDWLGDMGGLLDAMYFIGAIILSPFSRYALKSELINTMFRYRKSDESAGPGLRRTNSAVHATYRRRFSSSMETVEDENILLNNIRHDFQQMMPIKALKMSCFKIVFCCRSRPHKIMLKSQHSMQKELDLRKFIYRQRLQTHAVMGLLTGQ